MTTTKRLLAATLVVGLLVLPGTAFAAAVSPVGLGTAGSFAILAGTPSVTNTGPSIVNGNLGIHPAASVTGFPPGTVNGTISAGDAVALQAKSDLVTAYNDAAGRTPTGTVAGGTLGGQTLVGGVYNSGGFTLNLTGNVTLDGQNDPSTVWIFQATSDLVTASSSAVSFINQAQPCNVFWQVTSSATLGSDSTFAGTILALTSITMNNNVTLSGRALARNGTVTLINDRITTPTCAAVVTPTPTPSTSASASPSGSAGASPGASATPSASGGMATPGASAPTPSSSQPATRAPGVSAPTTRPAVTLPPTDTVRLGKTSNSGSNVPGVLVALAGLLVLASIVIWPRRRSATLLRPNRTRRD